MQVMQIAKQQGIVIPEQLSLVGYSNHPSSVLPTPSFTTIDQAPEFTGVAAYESLMTGLRNSRETSMVYKIVQVKIIERESKEV